MLGTFTVKAVDFLRTVGNAAVFAGSDDTLPVLNAVRLEVGEPDQNAEGTLTAVATDRYTLGIDTCDTIGVTASMALLVSLVDVQRILKATKGLGSRSLAYSFVVVTVESADVVKFDIGYDVSIIVHTVQGEFPKYRSLIPDDSPDPLDYNTLGVSPSMLARFAKVDGGRRSLPMTLTLGKTAGKPIKVSIGETFTGIQMPVRLSS